MHFEVLNLDRGIKHVVLKGRLDLDATLKLENPFAFQIATQGAPFVIDLTAVDFIASMGIRLLVKNAKAVQSRGGKLVLLVTTPLLREALTISGIASIIPLCDTLDGACTAALPSSSV